MRKILVLGIALSLAGCGTLDFMSSAPPVYVVFFPDHSIALTPDAQHIVDHAAADARAHGAQMIQITGPSTKIAPGYDPQLAEPRIETVEAALVTEGVDHSRLARASLTTTEVNVKQDPSGAQRVEIRLVDRPVAQPNS